MTTTPPTRRPRQPLARAFCCVFCSPLACAVVCGCHPPQARSRDDLGDLVTDPPPLNLESSDARVSSGKPSRKSFFRRGKLASAGSLPHVETAEAKANKGAAMHVQASAKVKKHLGDFSHGLAKMIGHGGSGDKKPDAPATAAAAGEAPVEMPGEAEVLAQFEACIESQGLEKHRALYAPLSLEDKWQLVRESVLKGGDKTKKTSKKTVKAMLLRLQADPSVSHIEAVRSFLQTEALRGITKFFEQGGAPALVACLASFEGKHRKGVESQDAVLLLLECVRLALSQVLGWTAMCEAGAAVMVAGLFDPAYGVLVRLSAVTLLHAMVEHNGATCALVVTAWAVRARSNAEKYRFEHLLEAVQPAGGFDLAARLSLASFINVMVSCTQDRVARIALRQELLHHNYKSILAECAEETASQRLDGVVGFDDLLNDFRRLQLSDLETSAELAAAKPHAVDAAALEGADPWKRMEAALSSDELLLELFRSVTGSVGKLGTERASALWKWQAADRLLRLVTSCPFQLSVDPADKPADPSSPESLLAALLLGGAVQEEIIELRACGPLVAGSVLAHASSAGHELYVTRLALVETSAAANLTIRDLQLQLEDACKRKERKAKHRERATLPRVPPAVAVQGDGPRPEAVIEIASVEPAAAAAVVAVEPVEAVEPVPVEGDAALAARNAQLLEKGRVKRRGATQRKKKRRPQDEGALRESTDRPELLELRVSVDRQDLLGSSAESADRSPLVRGLGVPPDSGESE